MNFPYLYLYISVICFFEKDSNDEDYLHAFIATGSSLATIAIILIIIIILYCTTGTSLNCHKHNHSKLSSDEIEMNNMVREINRMSMIRPVI